MRLLAVVSCCALLAACPTTVPPAGVPDVGQRPDSGRFDGGPDTGNGTPDASNDADIDAFAEDTNADSGDANVATDGGGFDPGACVFDASMDLFEIDTDPRAHPARIHVAATTNVFALTYSKLGTDAFQNVWFRAIDSRPGGLMSLPQQITHDTANTIDPTITHTSDGWTLAWASNSGGTMDIYTLGSGTDGRFVAAPHRLTMDAVTQQAPVLAWTGSRTALAYTQLDATGTNPTTVVQHLANDGTAMGGAQTSMPAGFTMRPQAFVATNFGYLVGWSDPSLNTFTLPLDTTGSTAGTPSMLTSTPASDGSIALAMTTGTSGAAVYGIDLGSGRREVHAHLLDGAGPVDVERVLTIGMDQGRDAAIVPLGGGYAVAYRQTGTPVMLRVLFLNAILDEVARLDLTTVSTTGGALSMAVSADGSVLVTWVDVMGTESHIRAARVRCGG